MRWYGSPNGFLYVTMAGVVRLLPVRYLLCWKLACDKVITVRLDVCERANTSAFRGRKRIFLILTPLLYPSQ